MQLTVDLSPHILGLIHARERRDIDRACELALSLLTMTADRRESWREPRTEAMDILRAARRGDYSAELAAIDLKFLGIELEQVAEEIMAEREEDEPWVEDAALTAWERER